MQKYFDESGDLGDPKKGSNTNYFVISIYNEESVQETLLIENKIRQEFKLPGTTVLKWNKLNKDAKAKFATIFLKLLAPKVFVIYCNKKDITDIDFKVFEKMMIKIIGEFNLFGNYKYEGEHLNRFLEKIRKSCKSLSKKISFTNSNTKENFGIQICDLCAGYIHYKREKGEEVNFKNIIKFSQT